MCLHTELDVISVMMCVCLLIMVRRSIVGTILWSDRRNVIMIMDLIGVMDVTTIVNWRLLVVICLLIRVRLCRSMMSYGR